MSYDFTERNGTRVSYRETVRSPRATGIRLSLITEMDFRGNYISKEKTNTIDAFIL